MKTTSPVYELFYNVNTHTLEHFTYDNEWMSHAVRTECLRLVAEAMPDKVFDITKEPNTRLSAQELFTGTKEEIEAAAVLLSSIMHRETRARLFDVTTRVHGTRSEGIKSANEHLPERELFTFTPETVS